MPNFEEEFKKLSELAEQQKEKKMRLKGSLDTLIKQLKEMGFSTPIQVKKVLKEKREKLDATKNKKIKLMEEFKKRYAEYL